jgi:glycerol-3-phosphate cytidylyltransferase
MEKIMRVYADMTADLFHSGHIEFLKQARALGDYLIVGIMSDEDVTKWKRPPILNIDERVAVVAACRYVDEAIPNAPWITDADWIAKNNIDIVVHGDDYSEDQLDFSHKAAIDLGIFRPIPYTPGISSTDIILRCKEADLETKAAPSIARTVEQ